jgi:hypothetical protein
MPISTVGGGGPSPGDSWRSQQGARKDLQHGLKKMLSTSYFQRSLRQHRTDHRTEVVRGGCVPASTIANITASPSRSIQRCHSRLRMARNI